MCGGDIFRSILMIFVDVKFAAIIIARDIFHWFFIEDSDKCCEQDMEISTVLYLTLHLFNSPL